MDEKYLAKLIALAGGEIVGRTKLQKIVYLLDQLGQKSGFHYSYHHYGPYSEDLARQIDIEKYIERSLQEVCKPRETDGATYSVFQTDMEADFDKLANLGKEQAERLLAILNPKTSTVLELAATIHWLKDAEKVDDWEKELVVRKGAKTDNGRKEQAARLLDEIGL